LKRKSILIYKRLEIEMIVLRSTYDRAIHRIAELEIQCHAMVIKWNGLVERINKLGGEDFLQQRQTTGLDSEDIKKLILLCHPDKHNNKDIAHEMTQKLLELRKRKP
jgi:hypothetical protein